MFQTVTILGFAGKDSDLRYTPSGTPVLSWSTAVKSGQNTLWFSCSLFGPLAEVMQERIKRGVPVLVSGYLNQPYVYEDRSGNHVAQMQMVAQTVRVLTKDETSEDAPINEVVDDNGDEDWENIPF
jgi:single-strand DNA-binding protein